MTEKTLDGQEEQGLRGSQGQAAWNQSLLVICLGRKTEDFAKELTAQKLCSYQLLQPVTGPDLCVLQPV